MMEKSFHETFSSIPRSCGNIIDDIDMDFGSALQTTFGTERHNGNGFVVLEQEELFHVEHRRHDFMGMGMEGRR